MTLLYANDTKGAFPPSWYAATAKPPAPFAPLRGRQRADVCIIGGGFTGLSAALHLAQAGVDVALVEAHRVGWGASGRNGGQVGSGQRRDQDALERLVGQDDAAKLWQLGEEAKALIHRLTGTHGIDCGFLPGVVHADCRARDVAHSHAYADHLSQAYGYGQIEPLNRDQMRQIVGSKAYHGGYIDHGAGHLHPLKLAYGLTRAARGAGARIFERSEAVALHRGAKPRVQCDHGDVTADHVILAANGYLGRLVPEVARRVMPINNFILATPPLGDRAADILTRDVAVADSQFVVNYFRLTDDKRLLFGGGETYGYRFPKDIAALVRKPMTAIFPQLADVGADYAWGGTLAITMQRLPHIARVTPNIVSASGYSGHGLALSVLMGRILSQAIEGPSDAFDVMSRLPTPCFPGGSALRSPLLTLAMGWYALRDRIGK